MAAIVPITDARAKLADLIKDADEDDVMLMQRGRPTAVLMSVRRHEELLEELEDLRDRLSVHEREGVTIDLDKALVELGLND